MWDQRYSEPGFYYGTEPNDFLAAHARQHFAPGAEVLSLGEGEGRNGVFLARQGFRVTGVDGSAVGLAKAQELAARHGVELHTEVTDLATYDFGVERWDVILSLVLAPPRRDGEPPLWQARAPLYTQATALNCQGSSTLPRSAAKIAACRYAAGSLPWSFSVSSTV